MKLLTAPALLTIPALLTLPTACTDPRPGANFGFGSGGMSFSPSISGQVGGAHVTISG